MVGCAAGLRQSVEVPHFTFQLALSLRDGGSFGNRPNCQNMKLNQSALRIGFFE